MEEICVTRSRIHFADALHYFNQRVHLYNCPHSIEILGIYENVHANNAFAANKAIVDTYHDLKRQLLETKDLEHYAKNL